jgi:hypothetical protein
MLDVALNKQKAVNEIMKEKKNELQDNKWEILEQLKDVLDEVPAGSFMSDILTLSLTLLIIDPERGNSSLLVPGRWHQSCIGGSANGSDWQWLHGHHGRHGQQVALFHSSCCHPCQEDPQ